jgi:hypothetical protein
MCGARKVVTGVCTFVGLVVCTRGGVHQPKRACNGLVRAAISWLFTRDDLCSLVSCCSQKNPKIRNAMDPCDAKKAAAPPNSAPQNAPTVLLAGVASLLQARSEICPLRTRDHMCSDKNVEITSPGEETTCFLATDNEPPGEGGSKEPLLRSINAAAKHSGRSYHSVGNRAKLPVSVHCQ